MTTYQEPPLHSRRAARQGERNAAYGQQPEPAAEPLIYSTQNRPPLPQYDGPGFRARRTPEGATGEPQAAASDPSVADARAASGQPVTQMLPEQEMPSYRPRDFSPEGRHGSDAAPQSAASGVERVPSAPLEHTITRRELRALREAQGAHVNVVAGAPSAGAPLASVPDAPAPEAPTASSAPEAQTAPAESGAPAAAELSPFEALFAAPSTPRPVSDFAPDPIAPAPVAEPVVLVEPVAPPGPAAPSEIVVAEPVASETAVAPSGHWTTQADLDDATQTGEAAIGRGPGVGSGVITTSALVLPSLPTPDYAQLGTGEILVTGSIDLPHSLATSGAHPTQLDDHDLDHELDPGDHQVVSTDSQPVRAVKAISSHTSTRNVIAASKKPVGNRALTALIISAAAMAAVVVTLLVVGLASGVL